MLLSLALVTIWNICMVIGIRCWHRLGVWGRVLFVAGSFGIACMAWWHVLDYMYAYVPRIVLSYAHRVAPSSAAFTVGALLSGEVVLLFCIIAWWQWRLFRVVAVRVMNSAAGG